MPCDAPVTTATFRSTLMTDSFGPHNFHTVGFGITGDRDATRLMGNQLDEGVADTLVPAVSASLLQRRQLAAQRANLLESRGRELREFPFRRPSSQRKPAPGDDDGIAMPFDSCIGSSRIACAQSTHSSQWADVVEQSS